MVRDIKVYISLTWLRIWNRIRFCCSVFSDLYIIWQKTGFVLLVFLYPEVQSIYAFASKHNQIDLFRKD